MPDALAGPHGAMALLLPAFAKMAIDVGLYEPMFDTVYISLQALMRGESWAVTVEGAPPELSLPLSLSTHALYTRARTHTHTKRPPPLPHAPLPPSAPSRPARSRMPARCPWDARGTPVGCP